MKTINRIDESIRAMQGFYPDFMLEVDATRINAIAVWKGIVQPLQTINHFDELLDDIYNARPVYVQQGGKVMHDPDCKARHTRHSWMNKISDRPIAYNLRVKYEGGPQHPRAYIVSPAIPENNARHMFRDGAICAYPPWQDVWLWQRDTVVQFMDHVLIWLINWTVWDQTQVWIGPEMPHGRPLLSLIIKPEQQCWCGSGKRFGECCRA
jgi:hypothetical protein